MYRANVATGADEAAIRKALEERGEWYQGVELAPCTLDSLVTWDVSGHARREQDRLQVACRPRKRVRGGY